MKDELRNLVAGWKDLWRYPALVAALERPSSEFTLEEIVIGLLTGLAADHDPRGAIAELLDRGEFTGADRALGLLEEATDPPSDRELESLRQYLMTERGRALGDCRARAASLARRARQVGLSSNLPADLQDLATRRRGTAVARLNDWEQRISEQEQKAAGVLRDRLVTAEPAASSDWARAVLRCIEARAFDAAEHLLRGGPGAVSPDTPAAFPPCKPWPYADQAKYVAGWFLGTTPAPATFLRDWGTDDLSARVVIESLQRFLATGIEPAPASSVVRHRYAGVDESSVRTFAEALDAALGGPIFAHREVRIAGEGYETRLFGLGDSRAPWLPQGDGGVRLWVCRSVEMASPPVGPDAITPVCFFPSSSYIAPRSMLAFDCSVLFRSLADQGRLKVHLLRELGAKVELSQAAPVSVPLGIGMVESRTYIDWFLDLLGVPVAGSEILDLLVYHSGGRGDLLVPLLSAVFDILPNRQRAITAETVSAALRHADFLERATNALLSPLGDNPGAKAALAAVVLATEGQGAAVDVDFVAYVGEESTGCPAPSNWQHWLPRLTERGLLDRDLATGSYSLPTTGIGAILVETLNGSVAVDIIRDAWTQ
jgi:hypothetical protein